jgi:glycosyltransferase involved in cell wall biosynthesis
LSIAETIAVVGLRGFPNKQGGVEMHCEQLYTRLAAHGWRFLVLTRAPYEHRPEKSWTWRGISFRKVWTPRSKFFEAFIHTPLAVLKARAGGLRVLHLHAIGPGLFVPLARAVGMRVVFTHHGFDYRRHKWNALGKQVLRIGEWLAMRFANQVIAVSLEAKNTLEHRFRREVHYVPNGVGALLSSFPARLDAEKLVPPNYAVGVGRLVPEKGWEDLAAALKEAPEGMHAVIVGGADNDSEYPRRLERVRPSALRFLGARRHELAMEIVRTARLFVLPSHHEGLPIAVLEAMALEVPVLASDIAPHREVIEHGVNGFLFPLGNVAALRDALVQMWSMSDADRRRIVSAARRTVAERYTWERAAASVDRIYHLV